MVTKKHLKQFFPPTFIITKYDNELNEGTTYKNNHPYYQNTLCLSIYYL